MTEDHRIYQRGAATALFGFFIQLALVIALFILGFATTTPALAICAWYALGGLPLWAFLWVVFNQHKLERLESLEAEELAARHGTDSSMFEVSADDLSIARRRLRWLYKWVMPLVTLVTATYLIVFGVLVFAGAVLTIAFGQWVPDNALLLTAACIGIAVIAFLFSRYIAGMSRVPAWVMLRGGAAYLIGNAAVVFLVGLGLVAADQEYPSFLGWMQVLIPALMLLLGIEFVLNFILEIYRPRKAGELPRPAFESRLLGMLVATQGIGKTISEFVNFQFGFEVTRSWFWQLLSKAFLWLVGFAFIVLVLVSTVVVVEPQQMAIVTTFGRLAHDADNPPLGPGIHFKAPWPVSSARYYDVAAVRAMRIGSAAGLKEDVPILWNSEHYEGEAEALLVAPPREALSGSSLLLDSGDDDPEGDDEEASKAPPNFLVNIEVIVHYRIDPDQLVKYVVANADAELQTEDDADHGEHPRPDELPDGRLRVIAESQVSRYLLAFDIDEWIGEARTEAGDELMTRIQSEATRAGLGVVIDQVTVASVHPPKDVADAFDGLVGAQQEKLTKIERAHQEAVKVLARVAGNERLARRIAKLIEEHDAMEVKDGDAGKARLELEQRIARLVQEAGGEAAVLIAAARAERWNKENAAAGRALRYDPQSKLFMALPKYYPSSLYLRTLAEGLAGARKIIVISESGELTIRGDLKTETSGFGTAIDELGAKPSP